MAWYLFLILSIIFGLAIGSFLNALIWRVNTGRPIFWKRSECPKCGHQLAARDLVPLFSFLALRGKCGYCGEGISWQYPIVEFATAFLFAAFYIFTTHAKTLSDIFSNDYLVIKILFLWLVTAILITIFVYDAKYRLIPDRFTVPSIFAIFAINFFIEKEISELVFGIAIGGGFFLFQYLISRGRWIGGGDIRLGMLMGAILGFPNILPALFLAYILGSAVSLVFIASGKKTWESAIPFAPFLVSATIITIFFSKIFSEFLRIF